MTLLNTKIHLKKTIVAFYICCAVSSIAHADLIPGGGNGSDLYYNFGGGSTSPLPPTSDNNRIPLDAHGTAGLGYNCGAFNPQLSLVNSLNSIESSYEQMVQNVITNAKGALMEMPAYIIARADPSLYQQIQNGLFNANHDLDISTRTCQEVANMIGQGGDPYDGWLKASMGDKWKYEMGEASSSLGSSSLGAGDSNGDINQAANAVNSDNGASGVDWVQGVLESDGNKYAGGQNQPPILVINDTIIAGYNILIDPANRAYDDKQAPPGPDANPATAGITSIFADPQTAANWATRVLGDNIITTYQGGQKSTSPGVGLLWDVQGQTTQIKQDLQQLVTGGEDITLANLQAVSAPRVMINQDVIHTIQQQTSSVMQAIIIDKLSTEVASARVIDEAQLTLQLLAVGMQAPPIYGNKPAQDAINAAISRLKEYINDFIFNNQVNQQFVSKTVTDILNETEAEQAANASIRPNENTPAQMTNGAISTGGH